MLSSAVRRSNATAPRPDSMNARCVWQTPFGRAGRARGVEHHRDVLGRALGHFGVEVPGIGAVELAALFLQPGEREHALVVAHPALVVEVDVPERGHLGHRLLHLVDLLLVLDDRVGDLGVVQHVDEVGRGGVLVHRHRHAAQRLRGGHRPVQTGAVVADDREVHAAAESLRGQPAGKRANLGGGLAPRPGLPDAEVLLAHRRVVAANRRVMQQQARKRVEPGFHLLQPSLCWTSLPAAVGRCPFVALSGGSPILGLRQDRGNGRVAPFLHAAREPRAVGIVVLATIGAGTGRIPLRSSRNVRPSPSSRCRRTDNPP